MEPSRVGARIRSLREKLNLTRAELAFAADIGLDTLTNIENNGQTPRTHTLRKLSKALKIEPQILLNGYPDEFGVSSNRFSDTDNGIVTITSEPHNRVMDYKKILFEASGDIFISGTSMISLSEDSVDLIEKKVLDGATVRLLILNPDWIRENWSILSFLASDNTKQSFHYEISNSISKLSALAEKLPPETRACYQLKSYSTIFPYIVTGFTKEEKGACVAEITDYLPERSRPRFLLSASGAFFQIVLQKFNSLWDSPLSKSVF